MRQIVAFLLLSVPAAAADVPAARDVLTNEGLVTLAAAGFSEQFLVEKIRRSRTRFDTSVEGLVYLRGNGLSEELIRGLLERETKTTTPAASAPASVLPVVMIRSGMWKTRVSYLMLPDPPSGRRLDGPGPDGRSVPFQTTSSVNWWRLW
ncbi:MAG: hypothetical protein IPM24_04110 [Bryobacterales bacterium]|nr:hypothetical protein [Bryobacterales bacterium]